jgi:hypothetical protein
MLPAGFNHFMRKLWKDKEGWFGILYPSPAASRHPLPLGEGFTRNTCDPVAIFSILARGEQFLQSLF